MIRHMDAGCKEILKAVTRVGVAHSTIDGESFLMSFLKLRVSRYSNTWKIYERVETSSNEVFFD